jgi:hypothetical protein
MLLVAGGACAWWFKYKRAVPKLKADYDAVLESEHELEELAYVSEVILSDEEQLTLV